MPTLLFDIDGTLFDSNKFLADIKNSFSRILKTPHEKISDTIVNYYTTISDDTKFTPEGFVDFFAKTYNASKDSLWENFWNDKSLYLDSIYPDTVKGLNFAFKHFSLGTFSQGISGF